jgi:hypothetical protein
MTTSVKPKSEAQQAAQIKAKQKAKLKASMNRRSRICSECNKFCSIEVGDPEVELPEVDGNQLTGTVTVTLQSACCNADLVEEAYQELEYEVDLDTVHDTCTAEPEDCQECQGTGDVEEECGQCGGSGIWDGGDHETGEDDTTCPECDGTGKLKVVCEHCDGEGKEPWTDEDERYEVEDYSGEPLVDSVTTDRKGKAIRNPRYQATLYGAEVSLTVKCNRCGESFDVTESVTERASSY